MDYDKLYMGGETIETKQEDKKKLNIERANEELFNLENEINKIYNELNENKDFSLYKISYLLKKIQVMQIRINEIITTDTYKDVKDKYKVIRNKILLILVIGLPLMNIIPYIALPVCAVMVGLDLKYMKDMKDIQRRFQENSSEFFVRLTSFKNTSMNSISLIQEKLNLFSNKSKLAETAQQEDKFIIANNIIVDLVNNEKSEYIDENLSQEVCNIIRRILQDDLNTTETNLSILIDMARNQNKKETLLNEFGVKRKVLEDEL